ncbi:MAG: 16S rRNA (cytosine(1402)-N(4))-methyltransferase RsmH [Magnetococcales bacterium]|nr:16S rRNA (cytosine(1402)-N(4))-methyltransferase RsmH [Magnetococcales bacterium]
MPFLPAALKNLKSGSRTVGNRQCTTAPKPWLLAKGSVPSSEPVGTPIHTELGSAHQSVLSHEAVTGLAPGPEGIYLDATFGAGGHSQRILEATSPGGRVVALDRDPEAIRGGARVVAHHPDRFTLIQSPFSRLSRVLGELQIEEINGVLFDLGVSSMQLDSPERGFSFQSDGPLDMRMSADPQMEQVSEVMENSSGEGRKGQGKSQSVGKGQPSAADLVNTLKADELADIIFRFGDERHSRRIARAIVTDRQEKPFTRTRELAGLLERILPRSKDRIHPATRTFQALRIAVNQELAELETGLAAAMEAVAVGGRIVVISFHSLEDRLVKQTFRKASSPIEPLIPGQHRAGRWIPAKAIPPKFRLLTRKPVMPTSEEIAQNPRSRSARMRILERLPKETAGESP